MSYITNVVIYTDDVEALTATEPDGMGSRAGHDTNKLVNVGHKGYNDYPASGGSKVFTSGVLLGAYNYLERFTFVEWVARTAFIDGAFLIMDTEGDVEVYRCSGGEFIQLDWTATR